MDMRSARGPERSTRSSVRCAASSVSFSTWSRRRRASGISLPAELARRKLFRNSSSVACRLLFSARRSSHIGSNEFATGIGSGLGGGPGLQNLVELLAQSLGGERFDHVAADTGLRRLHNLFT